MASKIDEGYIEIYPRVNMARTRAAFARMQASIARSTGAIRRNVAGMFAPIPEQATRAQRSLGRVGGALERTGRGFSKFSQAIGIASFQMQIMGFALTAFVSGPLAKLAVSAVKAGLETAGGIEQAVIGIEALVKNKKKVQEFTAAMIELARKSPVFETVDLLKASQKMISAGVNIDKVNRLMHAMGNIGLTTGVSMQGMSQALEALSQMASKGKVSMEELRRQFANAGIPMKVVADGMGVTVQELEKMVAAGMPASKIFDALIKVGESKKFMEGAIRGSKTLNGQLQALQENVRLALAMKFLDERFHVKPEVTDAIIGLQNALVDLINSVDFTGLIEGFAGFVRWLQRVVEWYQALSNEGKQRVANIFKALLLAGPAAILLGYLGTALSTVTAGIGAFLDTSGKLMKFFGQQGTVLGLTRLAWLGWGLVIIAVIALLALFFTKTEQGKSFMRGFTESISKGWNETIKPALEALWNTVQTQLIPAFTKLIQAFGIQDWTTFGRIVGNFVVGSFWLLIQVIKVFVLVLSAIVTVVGFIINLFRILIGFLISAFMPVITAIGRGLFNALAPPFQQAFAVIRTVWNLFVQLFLTSAGAIRNAWNATVSFVRVVWQATVQFLQAAWGVFRSAFFVTVGALRTAWGAVASFFRGVWAAVTNFISTRWRAIITFMVAVINVLRGAWNSLTVRMREVWNAAVSRIREIWNAVIARLRASWSAFRELFFQVASRIRDFFATIGARLREIWNTTTARIRQLWQATGAFVRAVWNAFFARFQQIGAGLRAAWNAVTTRIREVWSNITGAIRERWNNITGAIRQRAGAIRDAMINIFQNFRNRMAAIWNQVRDKAQAIWNGIRDFIRDRFSQARRLAEGFRDGFLRIWNSIAGGMRGGANAIIAFLNRLIGALNKVLPKNIDPIPGLADGGLVSAGSSASAANVQARVVAKGTFATGGHVKGAGGPTDDKILAYLSNGEYVIRASAVKKIGVDYLDQMNKVGMPYATGGYVQNRAGYVPGRPRNVADAQRHIVALYKGLGGTRRLTSGYRPGDPLWHGTGVAGDFGGFNQDVISRNAMRVRAGILEYIHSTGKGNYGISRGGVHNMGGGLYAAHRNHVHIAATPADVKNILAGKVGDAGAVGSGGAILDVVSPIINKFRKGFDAILNKFFPGNSAINTAAKGIFNLGWDGISNRADAIQGEVASGKGPAWAKKVIAAALAREGVPRWQKWMMTLVNRESRFDPNARSFSSNGALGHAIGLAQLLASTFARYRDRSLPNDRTHPLANLVASIRYIKARYGNIFRVSQANPGGGGSPGGYDNGGYLGAGQYGYNSTRSPELVLNAAQGAALERRLAGDDQHCEHYLMIDGKEIEIVAERVVRKNEVKLVQRARSGPRR